MAITKQISTERSGSPALPTLVLDADERADLTGMRR